MATKRTLTIVSPTETPAEQSTAERQSNAGVDRGSISPPTPAAPATSSPARRRRSPARKARAGDIAPHLDSAGIERFTVSSAVKAAEGAQIAAAADMVAAAARDGIDTLAETLRTILAGASPDEAAVLRKALLESGPQTSERSGTNPDEELSDDWRDGGYPYQSLMLRKNYEKPEVPIAGGVAQAAGLGEGDRVRRW
jgi:hypothetical protein